MPLAEFIAKAQGAGGGAVNRTVGIQSGTFRTEREPLTTQGCDSFFCDSGIGSWKNISQPDAGANIVKIRGGQLNCEHGAAVKRRAVKRNRAYTEQQKILQRKGTGIDPSHRISPGKPVQKPHPKQAPRKAPARAVRAMDALPRPNAAATSCGKKFERQSRAKEKDRTRRDHNLRFHPTEAFLNCVLDPPWLTCRSRFRR